MNISKCKFICQGEKCNRKQCVYTRVFFNFLCVAIYNTTKSVREFNILCLKPQAALLLPIQLFPEKV